MPVSRERIDEYLHGSRHGGLHSAPLLQRLRTNHWSKADTALTIDGVYQLIKIYGKQFGVSVDRFGPGNGCDERPGRGR